MSWALERQDSKSSVKAASCEAVKMLRTVVHNKGLPTELMHTSPLRVESQVATPRVMLDRANVWSVASRDSKVSILETAP